MKKLASITLLFASTAATAAVTSTPLTPEVWDLKRDSTTLPASYPTLAACIAARDAYVEAERVRRAVATFAANMTCVSPRSARVTATADAPPPPASNTYYLSDCQAGAAATCVPGSDEADGRAEDRPKRTLASLGINTLPAGTRIALVRGGAWAVNGLRIENLNATPAAPLVFDDYGTGPVPLLRTTGASNGIEVGGTWGNTSYDGGYTFRNVTLDGGGTGQWGLWLVQRVRNVTLDNVEVTGYAIGIHSSTEQNGAVNVDGLAIRNSKIHRNRSMGFLGSFKNGLIEGSTFEANNFSGSNGNHAIYGSHLTTVAIRGNRFVNNSVVSGRCTGGNVTVHGDVDGLIVEGNTIEVPVADFSCYGFAITSGYTSIEAFRNVVVRNNTVSGIGYAAVAANAAPGIVVEGNVFKNAGAGVVVIPANNGPDADDAADGNAIVRNNTLCGGGTVINTAPGAVSTNNTVMTGSAGTTGVCAP